MLLDAIARPHRLMAMLLLSLAGLTSQAEAQALPPAPAPAPASTPMPAPEPTATLSYNEALTAALAHSTDVKRAGLQVEAARLDRSLADYDTDPKFTLQASWGTQRPKPAAGGSFREQIYGAALSYTLFDFGRSSAKREQLDRAVVVKDLAQDETKDSFVWSVARAYGTVIAAARLEKATREQLGLAEKKLADQRRNYQSGLRPQNDLVAAEVERGRVELTHRKAKEDLRLAKVQLCVLMGCPSDSNGTPNPHFVVSEKSLEGKEPQRYVQLTESWPRANNTSTEKRWQAQKEANAADRQVIDASIRPTVDLSLGVQQGGLFDDSWNKMKHATTGQIQISWDIPWNGRQRTAYEQVAMRERDIDLQAEAYRQSLQDKERIALTNLATIKEQWSLQERQLQLLQRQETLIRKSYEAGKASALDLNNAEADLMNLEVEQIKLLNSSLSAAIDLAEARGVNRLDALF